MASPKTLATRTFNSAATFTSSRRWKPFSYDLMSTGVSGKLSCRNPRSYRAARRNAARLEKKA